MIGPELGSIPLPTIVFLLAGAVAMIAPLVFRERVKRAHARRLSDRLERGSDRYFEELRSLETYDPARSQIIYQGIGFAIFGVGVHDLVKLFTN